MEKNIFKGTYTALITPFTPDGDVDFESFENIIEHQINAGIEGIVVCGSTGENFALTEKEKQALIIRAIEIANKRCQVIAGTGTNETHSTLDYTVIAQEMGADAALIVAPYYNKPTQEALFEHYRLIADECKNFPIIPYNVPGRTAVNINADTITKLANACPNIVGVKEASGDLDQMMSIIKQAPEGFALLSGDDSLTLPVILMGGKGIISVISNYAPKEFGDMTRYALNGEYEKARELHYKLFDLMNLNFIETNPQPVKYVMSKLGFCNEVYRMPLMPLTESSKSMLDEALKKADIKL